MSYGYCADCDRRDVGPDWHRDGTICPTCWDVRTRFVRAIEAGQISQEQIIYTQKGRHTRRNKMLSVLNAAQDAMAQPRRAE